MTEVRQSNKIAISNGFPDKKGVRKPGSLGSIFVLNNLVLCREGALSGSERSYRDSAEIPLIPVVSLKRSRTFNRCLISKMGVSTLWKYSKVVRRHS